MPALPVRTAALLLALAGCGRPELRVDYPPSEDRKSLILSVQQAETRTVRAVSLGAGRPALPITIAADPARVDLEAALYDRTLAELGIAEGELAPVAEGSVLPEPDAVFEVAARIGDDAQPDWTSRVGLSRDLAAFRTVVNPPPNPCSPLGVALFELPATSTVVESAAALTSTAALLATADGRFFTAGAGGLARVAMPAGTPSNAMVRAPDGRVLLASDGKLAWVDGRPSALTTMDVPRIGQKLRDVAAGRDGSNVELYAVTWQRGLWRFEAGRWRLLWQGAGAPDHRVRVAWIGPREVVAAPFAGGVVHYVCRAEPCASNETVTVEPLEGTPGPMRSVVHAPSFGTFAGGSVGDLVRRDAASGTWKREPGTSGIGLALGDMIPRGRGILIGGSRGGITELSPDGLCPTRNVVSANIEHLVDTGLGIFAATAKDSASDPTKPTPVAWLTPR